jgi:hypothetical protein
MVVQSSENWQRCDIADSLRSPGVRRPFVQGEMRSDFVAVGRIPLEDPAQVGLTEHDDVDRGILGERSQDGHRIEDIRISLAPFQITKRPTRRDFARFSR